MMIRSKSYAYFYDCEIENIEHATNTIYKNLTPFWRRERNNNKYSRHERESCKKDSFDLFPLHVIRIKIITQSEVARL